MAENFDEHKFSKDPLLYIYNIYYARYKIMAIKPVYLVLNSNHYSMLYVYLNKHGENFCNSVFYGDDVVMGLKIIIAPVEKPVVAFEASITELTWEAENEKI